MMSSQQHLLISVVVEKNNKISLSSCFNFIAYPKQELVFTVYDTSRYLTSSVISDVFDKTIAEHQRHIEGTLGSIQYRTSFTRPP